jgi:glycerol-3-phosphate O-acyltransferase
MFFEETVALPLWLVLLTCLLALLALLDRLLVPGARWFVRRRVNRAIEELNSRLHFQIRPFTTTRRRVLIANLTYDPQVLAAVEETAREEDLPHEVAIARVGRYAREIVPAFNAYLYFRLGIWLARRLARNLYRVRLGHVDEEALAAIAEEATVVFVMNHRSNMDYVLIAFLAAPRAALSYAAGEWARVWPLQSLVRAMGAYFVRRDSGNPLYRRVLQRYIQMATAGGVTQAVFPEGGLSRDGRLRAPKLGVLDYMLRGFQPNEGRDIVFVPVGINYDRVLEDRGLLGMPGPRATRRSTRRALLAGTRFLLRNLFLMKKRERTRFGYACVNFGRPVSLRAYLGERGVVPGALDRQARFAVVEALGELLMAEIGRAVPVPPVPLVASLFAQRPKEYRTLDQLAEAVTALAERLRSTGARLQLPGDDLTSALRAGLRALVRRGILERQVDGFTVVAGQRDLLAYYANSIAHLAGDEAGGTASAP